MNRTLPRHTFLLKLTDRPGGMEMVAAAFAQRGVSISTSLGNDGTLDPDGRATVLVTFAATPAKKEILRRALSRLSRVVSLIEPPPDAPTLRTAALIRLAPDAPAPALPPGAEGLVQPTGDANGETTYLVVGPPALVDALLTQARDAGHLRETIHAVIAL